MFTYIFTIYACLWFLALCCYLLSNQISILRTRHPQPINSISKTADTKIAPQPLFSSSFTYLQMQIRIDFILLNETFLNARLFINYAFTCVVA